MPKPESTQVTPDPKLEKRGRRHFSTEYKLKILAEAEACKHGELGALLRREKLYSAQLQTWRQELKEQGPEGLSKSKPGPTPKYTAEQKKIQQLERQVQGLEKKLLVANECISLQKKVSSILDHLSSENTQ